MIQFLIYAITKRPIMDLMERCNETNDEHYCAPPTISITKYEMSERDILLMLRFRPMPINPDEYERSSNRRIQFAIDQFFIEGLPNLEELPQEKIALFKKLAADKAARLFYWTHKKNGEFFKADIGVASKDQASYLEKSCAQEANISANFEYYGDYVNPQDKYRPSFNEACKSLDRAPRYTRI